MLIDFFNYILSAIFVFHIKLAKKICKISVVISDSHSDINQHILWRIKCIRPEILIHSGDWSTIDVYYDLAEYCKKIIGVAGNVESLQTDEFFRQSEIIEINNKKIFVIHELENKSLFLEKIKKYFLLIYGHTHRSTKKKIRDTFFFNAG
ncbi:MAG TPA: metallophosphoesterase family protein, partial [bacterium]|nr:metallophosphoesterase family protein [bacterium]